MIPAVGLLRRGKAGELAHGPKFPAIHVAVDPARVRKLTRWRKPVSGRRLIKGLDLNTTDGSEAPFRDPGLTHWPYSTALRSPYRAAMRKNHWYGKVGRAVPPASWI